MLHVDGERSALYPITLDLVRDLDRRLGDQIMKWRMFCANWTLETQDYYGKPIRYRGIRFEGSPREVFWGGHIEPFVREGSKEILKDVTRQCKERGLEPEPYLHELQELLNQLVVKTYSDMAETDQVLRGNGSPDSVEPVSVEGRVAAMQDYLANNIQAQLHAWPADEPETARIVELKPGVWGISFDLRALWQTVRAHLCRRRAQKRAATEADKTRS